MKYIKIISLPGGNASSCSQYFYRKRTAAQKGHIEVGEIAEVPDDELEMHLSTGKVMEVRGPNDSGPTEAPRKRIKPAAAEDGYDAVFAAQR